uniref:HMA domain-containing protein n=1 Tax=Davidia involucrata TaxID=16924 RepID=A0A5B6ZPP7_DAVIN
MGEEEKKMEEKKPEEGKEEKKAEKASEDKKEEKKTEDSKENPPPPQEIVLRVYMHCEGCARKVRRCLKGFEGVEDVQTDCKTQKVVVKGEKADPLKVKDRVEKKSHRQVELLSPIPKPPADDAKKPEEKEAPKPEEKKEEPQVIIVVLKVHMHCEACAQEIKKRILRMKGVENAEPDLKSSQVTVKGVFDPQGMVEYVYKRTGKHAVIVKQEPEKKEEEKVKEGKEEKKAEEGGKDDKKAAEESKDKKEGGGGEEATKPEEAAKPAAAAAAAAEETTVVELKKNDFIYPYPHNYQYYPPRFAAGIYDPYPPQMFSDENPNACSVM